MFYSETHFYVKTSVKMASLGKVLHQIQSSCYREIHLKFTHRSARVQQNAAFFCGLLCSTQLIDLVIAVRYVTNPLTPLLNTKIPKWGFYSDVIEPF